MTRKTVLRVMDRSGDTALPLDEAEAKRLFHEHVGKRLPAFQTLRPSGQPDTKVTSLSEVEPGSEVILVPAVVAG